MPPARSVALVAVGGGLGAVARVALTSWFPAGRDAFPWTTLAENVSGAFALALILTLLEERLPSDPRTRLLLCTGALGAFTTYSTLADELVARMVDTQPLVAGGYAAATVVGGFVAALAGARAARAWPWIRRTRRRRDRRGQA